MVQRNKVVYHITRPKTGTVLVIVSIKFYTVSDFLHIMFVTLIISAKFKLDSKIAFPSPSTIAVCFGRRCYIYPVNLYCSTVCTCCHAFEAYRYIYNHFSFVQVECSVSKAFPRVQLWRMKKKLYSKFNKIIIYCTYLLWVLWFICL